MRGKKTGRILKKIVFYLSVLSCFSMFAAGKSDIQVIESPEPTHIEKSFTELVLVKKIEADFDEKYFFARLKQIAAHKDGLFFVFDDLQNKIFKFNKDFRFVKWFGTTGTGKGDISPRSRRGTKKGLYLSKDGNLYVLDNAFRKLIAFTTDGAFVREIKFPAGGYRLFPVKGKKDNFFAFNLNPGKERVAVFNEKLEEMLTLFTIVDYKTFIIHKPELDRKDRKYFKSNPFAVPGFSNTRIDCLDNDEIVIYKSNMSEVYYFDKDYKLKKSFRVWPKIALTYYRKKVERLRKKLKSSNFGTEMFTSFCVDKDSGKYVYLGVIRDEKEQRLFYKFDLEGNLMTTYRIKEPGKPVRTFVKANNLFYTISSDNILIYKEEK